MALLWDDSKHGLAVTPKPKSILQFEVAVTNIKYHIAHYLQMH